MQTPNLLKLVGPLVLILTSFSCQKSNFASNQSGTEYESVDTSHNSSVEASKFLQNNSIDFVAESDAETVKPLLIPSGPTNMPTDPNLIEEGFTIDKGVGSTKQNIVTLEMIAGRPYAMKVGFNQNCGDGSWEDYVPSKALTLSKKNQMITISVQFKDLEGTTSPCYYASILHDNAGPDILFQKFPVGAIPENSATQIIVKVDDLGEGVKEVVCRFNQVQKNCNSGVNTIDISAMVPGSYAFSVEAVDVLGNSSSQTVQWQVDSKTKPMSLDTRVTDFKKVDVLFVMDNSPSMEYEQKSMAKRTSQFVSLLRGLDWQVAVTTTDPTDVATGDGRLVPMKGLKNQFVLTSATAEETAQQVLSKTLQRTEVGGKYEQGIRSNYRLIERWLKKEPKPRQFIRDGAQFATILISDEDESGSKDRNVPQNLINLMNTTFGGQKRFVFHSIITRPGDKQCRKTYGATFGVRYAKMSTMTNGLVGDVCATDYAGQIGSIAEGIHNLFKTLSLSCEPAPGTDIRISKEGVPFGQSFIVQGVNLQFDSPLEPGNYHVDYHCLK